MRTGSPAVPPGRTAQLRGPWCPTSPSTTVPRRWTSTPGQTLGGHSVSLAIAVADVNTFVEHLAAHGVTVERAVEDGPGAGQRHAWVVDPYGHRWHVESPAPAAGRAAEVGPA